MNMFHGLDWEVFPFKKHVVLHLSYVEEMSETHILLLHQVTSGWGGPFLSVVPWVLATYY